MLKEAICIGVTKEIALLNACKELGFEEFDADKMDFEILELPSKKVLGLFGGRPAKVKLTLKISAAQAAEDFVRGIVKGMELSDIQLKDNNPVVDFLAFAMGLENIQFINFRGPTLPHPKNTVLRYPIIRHRTLPRGHLF